MSNLKIDLVSDVVCPWCAIGYARLRQAMALLEGEIVFDIEWHPFVLNPDVSSAGRPILAHLAHKYGRSEQEMVASQDQIMAVADELGLNFAQALERRSWNTFDTHRVLVWAKEQGRDTDYNLALFDAYFGRAENPTDPEILRTIAVRLDLDASMVDAILNSDHYARTVQKELDHYRALGVSAVPSFIVDNRYLLAGAQEPSVLADAFRRLVSEASVVTVG